MARSKHFSVRAQSRGSWRRRLAVVVLLLLAAAVAGGWYLTRPARLASLGEQLLHRLTGAEVSIAAAHLSWDGHVDLEGVSLRVPDLQTPAAQLFEAETVRVDANFTAMLTGTLRADSIVLVQPTLHITELADGGYNFEHLPKREKHEGMPQLPLVYVRRGEMRLGRYADGKLHQRGTLRLAGGLMPIDSSPTTYRFMLHQRVNAPTSGPRLEGTFDLVQHQFKAELQHFRFTSEQRQLLPDWLRKWWDQLAPAGTLPSVRLRYESHEGVQAEMLVRNAALNLPVPDLDARLSQVTGRFILEHDKLRIENLVGRLGAAQYAVDGVVQGFDRGAPLDVSVRTNAFTVPERPQVLGMLPANLRKHYDRFKPSGRFRLTLHLNRDRQGDALRYAGTLDILGAKGRYHKFPFPLHDARGRVLFSNKQAIVENLTAHGPGGSTIRLAGTVTPPRKGAAVQMVIDAQNVPVDEPLIEAMKPKHRKVLRQFFHEPTYQKLLAKGLIRAPAPPAPPMPPVPPVVCLRRSEMKRRVRMRAKRRSTPCLHARRARGCAGAH